MFLGIVPSVEAHTLTALGIVEKSGFLRPPSFLAVHYEEVLNP